MALRLFAGRAATALRVRCPVGLSRGFATVLPELKYAKSHEWVKVEGEVGTFGITDFAQSELGDIVHVDLPEVGTEVTKEKTFAVVESVKAASDIYAPVSGEVVAVNENAKEKPELVNSSPFTDGWLVKIKIADQSELQSLLSADAYTEVTEAAH
eukprot:TRINITY_DN14_c0_g1_i1.p1 TRINITY_DN14_c0_g1~~TRINITY_DN14_c0_g1_i1.p1  ORF type:complete len:155 (+),score=41.21 TRINITY_DN14_c0_g1_i1:198-662(+)